MPADHALPNPAQIARLLSLGARLDRQHVELEGAAWGPGVRYAPSVEEFFAELRQPCWTDHGYDPTREGPRLRDPDAVAGATLPELRAMLTHCMRSERFADGAWGDHIRSGRIDRVLARLRALAGADRGDHFAADWLRLREPLDHAARSEALTERLATWLRRRDVEPPLRVVDLGCGLGSNLRYLAPRLPLPQTWTVVDHDPVLLDALRALPAPRGVDVQAVALDLQPGVEAVAWRADLVVTSALLDLVSDAWLDQLARRCAREQTPVLAALTVDGRVRWTPSDADDSDVMRWFRAHQHTDRGFGPSPGPLAADRFASLLEEAGFEVRTAPADWRITGEDDALLEQMIDGIAHASAELSPQPTRVEAWRQRRQARRDAGELRLDVGHTDVLGLPRGPAPRRRRSGPA